MHMLYLSHSSDCDETFLSSWSLNASCNPHPRDYQHYHMDVLIICVQKLKVKSNVFVFVVIMPIYQYRVILLLLIFVPFYIVRNSLQKSTRNICVIPISIEITICSYELLLKSVTLFHEVLVPGKLITFCPVVMLRYKSSATSRLGGSCPSLSGSTLLMTFSTYSTQTINMRHLPLKLPKYLF